MIDSEALSIKLVLHAEKVASVINIVTWGGEVRSSLN